MTSYQIQKAVSGATGGARVATGKYTPDGNPSQSIVGLGFSPRVVIGYIGGIVPPPLIAFNFGMISADTILDGGAEMTVNNGETLIDPSALYSLDADGFTVAGGMNTPAPGDVYYIAIE